MPQGVRAIAGIDIGGGTLGRCDERRESQKEGYRDENYISIPGSDAVYVRSLLIRHNSSLHFRSASEDRLWTSFVFATPKLFSNENVLGTKNSDRFR
jgi:hypothetical protein